MKKLRLLICIAVLLAPLTSFGQNYLMKVWPDSIPGSIKDPGYIEKKTYTGDIVTMYAQVTDPDIRVYLPEADKNTGAAVLICPGGGYGILAFDHEGYAIARWLNENGIAGVILKYRLPSDRIMKDKSIGPLQDAQEAMRIIRRNSKSWKIDPGKVGVIGFSAGGHLASTLSTHYGENVYMRKDTVSARPDFSLLIYPVITFDATFTHMGSRENLIGKNPSGETIDHYSNEKMINKNTPPAFLVHSGDDNAVPVKNSIEYYNSMNINKVKGELHIFTKGGHGYGLAKGRGIESQWPELCIRWLKETVLK